MEANAPTRTQKPNTNCERDRVPTLVKGLKKYFVNWSPSYDEGRNKWLKIPTPRLTKPDRFYRWKALPQNRGAGIAASLEHHIVVLDVDGIDYKDNEQLTRLFKESPTYMESSPSGAPNKYHAIYALINKDQKAQLGTKPAVTIDKELKQEIQLFSSKGYTTLTGRSLEGEHEYATKEVAVISADMLTDLWPSFKARTTPLEPSLALQNAGNLTPLDQWIERVILEPDNPLTVLLREKLGYNHYDFWVTGLMAIKAAHGESHAAMLGAYTWSQSDSENFDEQDFNDTWRSISAVNEQGIGPATYEKYYKHFMPQWPVMNKAGTPTKNELENFMFWLKYLGLELKVDPITQSIFFDGPDSILYPRLYSTQIQAKTSGHEYLGKLQSRLAVYAREFKFRPPQKDVDAHISTIATATYEADKVNRFAREIDQVTWDGYDYVSQLADDIVQRNPHMPDPSPEFQRILIKKWLFTVVRTFWPDKLAQPHTYDTAEGMLIISSRNTGVGKSVFPQHLFPKEWQHLHIETIPNFGSKHEDKDFYTKISTALIVNFDEIDKMLNSKHEAALKSYVTASVDSFRAPYGRQVQKHPRRHATYSSTNKESLILARDGARRWWWINVDKIDIGVLKDGWPIMQMWAQVKELLLAESQAAYHGKAPWHLADSELSYLAKYVSAHTSENSLAIALRDKFDMSEEGFTQAVKRAEAHDYSLKEATLTQTQIAEILGVPQGKALVNTLKEELQRIAPPLIYYGPRSAAVQRGTYSVSRQIRYFMPTQLNEF